MCGWIGSIFEDGSDLREIALYAALAPESCDRLLRTLVGADSHGQKLPRLVTAQAAESPADPKQSSEGEDSRGSEAGVCAVREIRAQT